MTIKPNHIAHNSSSVNWNENSMATLTSVAYKCLVFVVLVHRSAGFLSFTESISQAINYNFELDSAENELNVLTTAYFECEKRINYDGSTNFPMIFNTLNRITTQETFFLSLRRLLFGFDGKSVNHKLNYMREQYRECHIKDVNRKSVLDGDVPRKIHIPLIINSFVSTASISFVLLAMIIFNNAFIGVQENRNVKNNTHRQRIYLLSGCARKCVDERKDANTQTSLQGESISKLGVQSCSQHTPSRKRPIKVQHFEQSYWWRDESKDSADDIEVSATDTNSSDDHVYKYDFQKNTKGARLPTNRSVSNIVNTNRLRKISDVITDRECNKECEFDKSTLDSRRYLISEHDDNKAKYKRGSRTCGSIHSKGNFGINVLSTLSSMESVDNTLMPKLNMLLSVGSTVHEDDNEDTGILYDEDFSVVKNMQETDKTIAFNFSRENHQEMVLSYGRVLKSVDEREDAYSKTSLQKGSISKSGIQTCNQYPHLRKRHVKEQHFGQRCQLNAGSKDSAHGIKNSSNDDVCNDGFHGNIKEARLPTDRNVSNAFISHRLRKTPDIPANREYDKELDSCARSLLDSRRYSISERENNKTGYKSGSHTNISINSKERHTPDSVDSTLMPKFTMLLSVGSSVDEDDNGGPDVLYDENARITQNMRETVKTTAFNFRREDHQELNLTYGHCNNRETTDQWKERPNSFDIEYSSLSSCDSSDLFGGDSRSESPLNYMGDKFKDDFTHLHNREQDHFTSNPDNVFKAYSSDSSIANDDMFGD